MVPCVTEGLYVLKQAWSLENRGPVVCPEPADIKEARRQWPSHTVQVGRAFSDKAQHPEGQVTTVTMTSPTDDIVWVPPMCQEPFSLISSSSPRPLQHGDYDCPHFIEKETEAHRREATSEGQPRTESRVHVPPESPCSEIPQVSTLSGSTKHVPPPERLSHRRCY